MQEVEGNVRNLSLERMAAGDDDVEMKEANEVAAPGGKGSTDKEKEKPTDATALAGSSTQPTADTVATPSTEQ